MYLGQSPRQGNSNLPCSRIIPSIPVRCRAKLCRCALAATIANTADRQQLIDTISDELTNTHAAGHFTADLLLKLGLTGTVIGFILMLLPIGEIEQFDPSLIQQLLSAMSGGMAIALYTTLQGL